jgi:hypothetical protein
MANLMPHDVEHRHRFGDIQRITVPNIVIPAIVDLVEELSAKSRELDRRLDPA